MYPRDVRRNIATSRRLAAEIIQRLRIPATAEVIDLGCGDGVFLEAVARDHVRRRGDRGVEGIATRLKGVEIDALTARRARARMAEVFGRPYGGWDIQTGDALAIPESRKYNYVVGNPPWVRAHHLSPAERAGARESFSAAVGNFDLSHLFIEKGLRLLRPGGTLAMIVPRGISMQPSARHLRDMLDEAGDWRIDPLASSSFLPSARIDPALLIVDADAPKQRELRARELVLGDVATVTSGIATGADSVFVLPVEKAKALNLEKSWLRPAVRGRDVRGWCGHAPAVVIWPYRRTSAGNVLADIAEAPQVAAYLGGHRAALQQRPRLRSYIRRHPDRWYRFIDPGRASEPRGAPTIALPDITRGSSYVALEGGDAVVMNTCFRVTPRRGRAPLVREVLDHQGFWERLKARSRHFPAGYFRTSASELRAVPLTGIAE